MRLRLLRSRFLPILQFQLLHRRHNRLAIFPGCPELILCCYRAVRYLLLCHPTPGHKQIPGTKRPKPQRDLPNHRHRQATLIQIRYCYHSFAQHSFGGFSVAFHLPHAMPSSLLHAHLTRATSTAQRQSNPVRITYRKVCHAIQTHQAQNQW